MTRREFLKRLGTGAMAAAVASVVPSVLDAEMPIDEQPLAESDPEQYVAYLVVWQGRLICDNPRRLGVITDIT